jgi:beta-glucosidase
MNTNLSPEQRADLLIPRMTLEQKVQQLSNDTRPAENPANRPPGCEFTPIGRHIQGIPELRIPTVRMINGGTGVRGGDCRNEPVATGLPSTPASAATFNPELSRRLGGVLGDEARRDGHQVMLAPGMNLHRHPYGGRNYEYQSEDPYLSGVMAVEQIRGIQAHGIHANAKHFAGNEQETQRRQMATVIPPRALHELYLLPFEMTVKEAQPASVMCAFPEINGVSACSSQDLLKTTLRERWGFGGYVITDRRAVHDVAPSIKAGVDWELSHITPLHYSLDPQPGQRGNPGSEGIRAALAAGSITVSDLDQMLRRRYVQMFKFGHFDTNFDALYGSVPDFAAHGRVAREIAEQGIVLLKNENDFLPLNAANIRSVALIGAEWYAGMAKLPPRSVRADNTNVVAPYTVTPQKGLENVLRAMGSSATVTYQSAGGTGRAAARAAAVESAAARAAAEESAADRAAADESAADRVGVVESAGGTGSKADRDAAVELAKKSDVVIVMVGDNPHELCDRESLSLPIIPPADPDFCAYDELNEGEYDLPNPPRGGGTNQERLMRELTAAPGVAQKMVVVLKTEGMVLMPWLDKVPALLEAWYPGQEDGNAVANILFGMRNPSGKLPMTFGNSEREAAYATEAQFPGLWVPPPHWLNRQRFSAQYTEGLQVGYRWYEANNVTPVFPFGFGLSYTTFVYSGLSVRSTFYQQTGHAVVTVTYTITNTGSREGAEASQVYVTLPAAAGQPSKRLVGFQKVNLMPGASQTVTITIDSSASNHPFSYWVPERDAPVPGWGRGGWVTAPGDYTVHVGTSSADTPLEQTITLGSPTPSASQPTVPSAPGPPSSSPQLLIFDSAHVARVRDSLRRGEPQFRAALTALEAAANRALSVAPMSVMDKEVTPPSGDKHDYMSQAPYWWPDPSKPDGRPYIRRDGRRNPEIDRITDRENLERLTDTVSTLALAFHFTGREQYAQHAARLVRVWFLNAATRMNPNLKFGQGIPGIAEGRAAGIIETRFLPTIIDGVTLLQGSSAWTGSDEEALKGWMRDYLKWLLESPLGRDEARRGNNQETWYDVQVVSLALYTGQPEVGRTNFEQAKADIREEFEPDGSQPRELARTRAWDYSTFNLTAFTQLAALGNRVNVDLWHYRTADGRSLRQGLDFLVPFATGEKRFPYMQITEFRPSLLHVPLRRAAIGLNEPEYRDLARQIGGETPRLELTLP